MAVRKDIDTAVKLKEFNRNVEKLLSPEDKDYLLYALKEYNTYKSIAKLMLALNSCLDTPEKLDLLPYIRDLIPRHDRNRFDSLAPYNRMAHPLKVTPDVKKKGGSLKRSGQSPTITLNLHRPRGAPLGFSIRGGREHELGVYVSYVDSLSLAEKVGLQVGDQIVNVNGIDFERVSHSSAVLVLKSHDDFKIEIRRVGKIPGQTMARDSLVWVDSSGNPVEETDGPVATSTSIEGRKEASSNGLPGASNSHKVVLHASKKRELGFSIRGGSEYGLGIYISSVDGNSLAEEGGLQVGDQIIDVNGHSFLSILHPEAVHILRSYQTLILTITSLGRYPKLVSSEKSKNEVKEEKAETPNLRERTSSFFKSLTAPLSSPSQKRKSFHAEEEPQTPPAPKSSAHNLAPPKPASVKRSNSARSSEKPKSVSERKERPDSAKKFSSLSRGRSISLESGAFSNSPFKRPALAVSPLATHEARASATHSPSTTPKLHINGTASGSGTPKFFEKGIGSQLMLASTTSQAEQMLFDRARRLLTEKDVQSLKQTVEEYKDSEDVEKLASFLISTLDTPEKIQLLTDIRSILYPEDVTNFDKLVSLHELKALSKKEKQAKDERAHQHSAVLAEIQNHNGLEGLVKTETKPQPLPPDLGAFGSQAAQSVLHKATTPDSEQALAGLQSKESFLAWNESYLPDAGDEQASSRANRLAKTAKSPVVVELTKTSSFLGLSVNGGTDTAESKIHVRDVREGGIVHSEGFIKPGYEILEVDGIKLREKTHREVVQAIAEAFTSIKPTLKFIVVPL